MESGAGVRPREVKLEATPLANPGTQLDVAPVGPHSRAYQGQTQAMAGTGARSIYSIETVEKIGEMLGLDARTSVLNGDDPLV